MGAMRNLFSGLMAILFPLSLMGADTGSALLHTKGGVWVNGAEAPDASALFPGDLIETKPGFFGFLDAEGSSLLIEPGSTLKLQAKFVLLQRGGLSVGTSVSMGVRVSCIQVEPVIRERTEYDVREASDSAEVTAIKGDLKLNLVGQARKASRQSISTQSEIVHAGQQVKYYDSACRNEGTPPAATSVPLKWVAVGAGAAAAALCAEFCKGSTPSASPSIP